MKLLSKYKQSEKGFFWALQAQEEFTITVRKCAALVFQLLGWFGNFRAATSEKMYEKGLFAKLENKKGEL